MAEIIILCLVQVNFYVSDNDNVLKHVLWKNLLGLLYLRTSGEPEDLGRIRDLAWKFASLGAEVPIFAANADGMHLFEGIWEQMQWWDPNPGAVVNLQVSPYNLEQISFERG